MFDDSTIASIKATCTPEAKLFFLKIDRDTENYNVGLDTNGVKFLLYCNNLGVDFSSTAMIGRQNLHLSNKELLELLIAFNHDIPESQVDSIFSKGEGFAEQFLAYLGGKTIHSFDMSDFEKATDLHDMNIEIPEKYKKKYSVVLDSGSLEHVFNFPVAIKNCMEMVRVGGHFLSITPMNNFAGHGFYQFSPELFFSVFTSHNGFDLLHVLAFEDRPNAKWYSVNSPLEKKRRVILCNGVQTYLIVLAKKVAITPIFLSPPQQSDYLAAWGNEDVGKTMNAGVNTSEDNTNKTSFAILKAVTPRPIKRFAKEVLKILYPEKFSNITDPDFSTPFFPATKSVHRVDG